MLGSTKRRLIVASAAGALGLAGSAVGAGAASAAQFHINSGSTSGPAVAVGTPYTANTSSIAFTSSSGGVLAKCTASTLAGKATTVTGGTSGSPAAGLSVLSSGSSFSGCTLSSGSAITVAITSSPWTVLPTNPPPSGAPNGPFKGTVNGVGVSVTCGSTSATYSGNLTTNGTQYNPGQNGSNTLSQIVLAGAGSLGKTGTGCPTLPSSVNVTGTYTLATVNGATATSANNWWLSYS